MSNEEPGPGQKAGLRMIARALRSRNYRLFFMGQGISVIGTWMQQIALLWLVYRLTGSAFWLGFVGFVGRLPTFLIAPFAGVIADRYDRRTLVVVTQTLAMLQAFVVAALAFAGVITVWQIVALGVFLGLVNCFDIPVRQSFVVEMVDRREDLPNAIALNSLLMNGGRLIGPSLAGIIIYEAARLGQHFFSHITYFGEAVCFFFNGASYLAVIWALLVMRVPRRPASPHKRVHHELIEGFQYAFHHVPILSVLLLLTLVSLMGMPYAVLMPVVAKEVLHGTSKTYGFLMAAVGVGALMGAFLMATRRDGRGLADKIAMAAFIFGAGLVGFSLARNVPLAMVLLVVVGFGMMIQMVSSNTLLQTVVDDDKRGRVMSLYTMSFMGMAPFGSLLAGGLASWLGTPTTLGVSGVACILGAAGFTLALPTLNAYLRTHVARDAQAISRAGVPAAPDAPTTYAGASMPPPIADPTPAADPVAEGPDPDR